MTYISTDDIPALSKAAIDALIAGESDFLAALRDQFAHAELIAVREDGYGYFADYAVDPSLRILNPDLQGKMVTDVLGFNEEGKCVCGFALLISDGMIDALDGYPTLDDTWPNERVELKYANVDSDGKEYIGTARGRIDLEKYTFPERIEIAGSRERFPHEDDQDA